MYICLYALSNIVNMSSLPVYGGWPITAGLTYMCRRAVAYTKKLSFLSHPQWIYATFDETAHTTRAKPTKHFFFFFWDSGFIWSHYVKPRVNIYRWLYWSSCIVATRAAWGMSPHKSVAQRSTWDARFELYMLRNITSLRTTLFSYIYIASWSQPRSQASLNVSSLDRRGSSSARTDKTDLNGFWMKWKCMNEI